MSDVGTVYLVGAGPGDPGLITVRGMECLAMADVLIYDNLANPVFLSSVPADAEKIYVGKKAADHAMQQQDINQLLVDRAKAGKTVVRLKGGDPLVFGRGGEEAEVLADAGVSFEFVPGITAGVAAPAYAGIPVTHRRYNACMTFVTGHEDPEKEESSINWNALARDKSVLVFYMGVGNLPKIAARLLAEGMEPDTGAAVIRRGTHPDQVVVDGTLQNIAERVKSAGIKPPAITLVGNVIELRTKLKWFEDRPLHGKTIAITRSRTQASQLGRQLSRLGARVLQFPTIDIAPPDSTDALAQAIDSIAGFDWIVFTSVNAVDTFFKVLNEKGLDSRHLSPCSLCSIGPGTTAQLKMHGITPDLVPDRFTSGDIFKALRESNAIKDNRFLLPRADIAPAELPEAITGEGGKVTEVTAYKTLPGRPSSETMELFRNGEVDIVTFTSSSTARNFAAIAKDHLNGVPEDVTYISIGPVTTSTAQDEGMTMAAEAERHDIEGLVETILKHVSQE